MDLTALVDRYRGPLVGMIACWGAPWADAAEIAQDSFAEAWLRRESFRGDWTEPEAFGRWLRGIAHNRFRNWRRTRGRQRSRTVSLSVIEADIAAAVDEVDVEQFRALRAAIERLPSRHRQVVLMHYLEETCVRDVAALLSVSAKAVEGRLYQARRTLHRWLKQPAPRQFGKLLLCL